MLMNNKFILSKLGKLMTKINIPYKYFKILNESNLPRVYIIGNLTGISSDNEKDVILKYFDNENSYSFNTKIKYQGKGSLEAPVKNYAINLDRKIAFKDWKEQDSFHLKANYSDTTSAKNILLANLADKIYRSLNLTMSDNYKFAIDGFPIELYINNEFIGLYTWNLKQNASLYSMTNEDYMYRPEVGYTDTANYNSFLDSDFNTENGWECRNPKNNEDHIMIKSLIGWVKSSTDDEFINDLEEHFNKEFLIIYYIMISLFVGTDNVSNNQTLASFDKGFTWYTLLYDMDIACNNMEQATVALPIAGVNDSKLWSKVHSLLNNDIKLLYNDLRNDILTVDTILSIYDDLMGNVLDEMFVLDKEYKYKKYNLEENFFFAENNREYFKEWFTKRFEYLDNVFAINAKTRAISNYDFSKTYTPKLEDSADEYTDINLACDDNITLEIGDDLGICANLIPHHWNRTNPFSITTSDKRIVDVDGMVVTALKEGTVTLTATSLNGLYTDTATIKVVAKKEYSVDDTNLIYNLEPNRFGLVENSYEFNIANRNTQGLKSLIVWAKKKNYEKIIFPKDKIYYVNPNDTIYMKSNLIIDLNGSSIIAMPTLAGTYTLLSLSDSNKLYPNVGTYGWKGLTATGYTSYITDYSKNENNVMTYWRNYLVNDYYYPADCSNGGEVGSFEIENRIKVSDDITIDDYYQIQDKVYKNVDYTCYFEFVKYRTYDHKDDEYTANTITLTMDMYKNNELVNSKIAKTYNWTKTVNGSGWNRTFNLRIEEDIDEISFRIDGLSDPNYPVNVFLQNIKIYRNVDSVNKVNENIKIINGSILGDRYINNENGEEIKELIFKEYNGGSSWKNLQKTEGTTTIAFDKGKNCELNNLTIGNSPGFNLCIGLGEVENSYYEPARNWTIGNLNPLNGEDDDSTTLYIRSPYIKVNINNTRKFIVTDPTFVTSYYYGQQTRIIDVYYYDENKNLIKSLLGRFRHATLEAPEGTAYIRMCAPLLEGEEFNTTGNTDFSGCVFAIKFIYPTESCAVRNCTITNNYSCGMAISAYGFVVENNYFNNNIGRMPWCDVDSEDGWQRMQNVTFRGNSFNSYYGFIMCSGNNYVIKNNTFKCPVVEYADCQRFKWIKNTFITSGYSGGSTFGTSSDQYITKNIFKDNFPITPTLNNSSSYYRTILSRNILNSRIGGADSTVFDNNIINKNISILKNVSGILDNISYDKSLLINKIDIEITDFVINNSVISKNNELYLGYGKSAILNNCNFEGKFTFGDAKGKLTFNKCEIINKRIHPQIEYNNCNEISGIIDEFCVDNLIKDGLFFTAKDVLSGTVFDALNVDSIMKGTSDYHITMLADRTTGGNYTSVINGIYNGTTYFSLGSSATKNAVTANVRLLKLSDSTTSNSMWSQVTSKNVVGTDLKHLVDIDYIAAEKKYRLYINNYLIYTKTISGDYVQHPVDKIELYCNGNNGFNYVYVYNPSLTDEEMTSNYNNIWGINRCCFIENYYEGIIIHNYENKNIIINSYQTDKDITYNIPINNNIVFSENEFTINKGIISKNINLKLVDNNILNEEIIFNIENTFNNSKLEFKVIKNILNYDYASYEDGYYNDNGELVANKDTYVGTAYIEVEANSTYTVKEYDNKSSNIRYTLFDENKIFISRNSVNTKTCDITTTENCKYIKIGFGTTDPESSFANYTLIKK